MTSEEGHRKALNHVVEGGCGDVVCHVFEADEKGGIREPDQLDQFVQPQLTRAQLGEPENYSNN